MISIFKAAGLCIFLTSIPASADITGPGGEPEPPYYQIPPSPVPPQISGRRLISGWARSGHPDRPVALTQIPTLGKTQTIGPCGSQHYSPLRDGSVPPLAMDTYADPTTACVFMALLQEWRKTCSVSPLLEPEPNRCTPYWGDISHRNQLYFDGHESHTQGQCMDIRPFRRNGPSDRPMTVNDFAYDREQTKKFLQLAQSLGGTKMLLSDSKLNRDTSLNVKSWVGHENHMHICFPPGEKTSKTCDEFIYDPAICENNPFNGVQQ